ncbi:MAG: hypothetical protein MI717_11640 [Spirochaetales bacterium]|nr:hypothetical protein [Spirochaetales bacterium]
MHIQKGMILFMFCVLIWTAFGQGDLDSVDYDVVIAGGRVIDPETQFDETAFVGIVGEKIQTISSKPLLGKRMIDAQGLVVAPGFIDTHVHQVHLMGYKLLLRDGVTSALELELGVLGTKVAQWYASREGQMPLNLGVTTSHELARSLVLDGAEGIDVTEAQNTRSAGNLWSVQRPSLEEANQILSVLDEGLREGALGVGSTLGYMRTGVSAREMFEVQRLASSYGRLTSVHFRSTPGTDTQEANGLQEVLANAMVLDAPLIACHFNNPGWPLVHELLLRAREKGRNVWGEIYPYEAGSTSLNSEFLAPEIWEGELGFVYEESVLDPVAGEFITLERYKELMETDPSRLVVIFKMPQEEVPQWLMLPGVSIGGDGMPIPPFDQSWDTPFEELANTHPRTSGAHAKALRLGREHQIPLMQLISQLSYVSAKGLGDAGVTSMQVRGRLQEGMVADITIFDPETVTDQADFEVGTRPSMGIPYVLVSGKLVVDEGIAQGNIFPGKAIRYDVREEGQHQDLDKKHWIQNHLILPLDFGGLAHLGEHSE